MSSILYGVLVLVLTGGVNGEQEARVKCRYKSEVYVDGNRVGTSTEVLFTQLSSETQLLAVECRGGGGGALLVSVGDILISDDSWKCSSKRREGWREIDFDDSGWNNAYQIERNDGLGRWENVPEIEGDANWISASSNYREYSSIYCRGRTGIILRAHCQDGCDIHVDGNPIVNNLTTTTFSRTIPRTSRLIGVDAYSASEGGVILVSVSNGFQSNEDWRCLSTPESNEWREIGYDDGHWPRAAVQTGLGKEVDAVFDGVLSIWTDNSDSLQVNCRGKIECGCQHECVVQDYWSFLCECPDGYILADDGSSCRDPTCEELPGPVCQEVCVRQDDRHTCGCQSGFTLNIDGFSCSDLDECLSGTSNCTDFFQCQNTVGSYKCFCPSGFSQSGTFCNDVDECETGNHNCHNQREVCTNLIGGFECHECMLGYVKVGNRRNATCEDVNECATTKGGCEHTCNNTEGSYVCSCSVGYILSGDSKTCFELDCDSVLAPLCEQLCIIGQGGFECECREGFVLTDDGVSCIDVDECETGLHDCTGLFHCNNSIGSYSCVENTGRKGGSKGSASSGGVIGGAVVGVVIPVVVVCIAVYITMLHRRRKAQKHHSTKDEPENAYYNVGLKVTSEDGQKEEQQTGEEGHEYDYAYQNPRGDEKHEEEETAAAAAAAAPSQSADDENMRQDTPEEGTYESLQPESPQYANAHIEPYEDLRSVATC